MSRPFRLAPPAVPERALERRGLLDRLRSRWDARITVIQAGPGFGKTTLLAAALAEAATDGVRHDVWLCCEPSDESADHLCAGLAAALGVSSVADVDALVDAVWSHAPNDVCLVLDDVHEIPVDSPGAALLQRLADDLPANAHLVLASRDAVPVRTARLAAADALVRLSERDLTFTSAELETFARTRAVDSSLLSSTGGWPALAELTASTGQELVTNYLWEEVLAQMGAERSATFARLVVVGGGDDDIASAVAGDAVRVDDVVAGLPLIARSGDGWRSPHPLWTPAVRHLVGPDETREALRNAAQCHLRAHRLGEAVDLLVEAEGWPDLLSVLRDAEMHLIAPISPGELGRWSRCLPPELRREPEALLASGLELQPDDPFGAVGLFRAAGDGFRARGDIDGEAAAIAQEALVLWWANDIDALLSLVVRLGELADAGAELARALATVGAGGAAHLAGDSTQVLSVLDEARDDLPAGWSGVVHWLRSVAHRRNGALAPARRELAAGMSLPIGGFRSTLENAELQIAWLEGDVERACRGADAQRVHHRDGGHGYLERETTLELAHRSAVLGRLTTAREMLDRAETLVPHMPSSLARTLRAIAAAAVSVGQGDEASAATVVADEVTNALDGPDGWYWRDRAAIALTYVLVPETRDLWACAPLGPAHQPALVLAVALEEARNGDLGPAAALAWPEPGVVRAHVPVRWVAEIAVVGRAAGNPPPAELARALGNQLRGAVAAVADTHPDERVRTAAAAWVAELPAIPAYRLDVRVLGPLELRRNEDVDENPALRRRRVRELLGHLVEHRRARRETAATALWPDLDDGGRNLRVTLSYLQRCLQPDRTAGDPPYFLRSDGTWLELGGDDRLTVDVWTLEDLLDDAEVADRDGVPGTALTTYEAALALWRGEPYVDVSDAPWAVAARARITPRVVRAATRAGELLLAAGRAVDAARMAERAVDTDPWHEPAYRLLIRVRLSSGDRSGALELLDACRCALAQLDLEPDPTTTDLLRAHT